MDMIRSANAPLDPSDWSAFEDLLVRVATDVRASLEHLEDQPVWQRPPRQVRDAFDADVPMSGQGLEATYDQFKRFLYPYVVGNRHPHYLGWVVGSGVPSSMVGDWLSALVNSVPTIFDDSSVLTELQVLKWITKLVGMPAQSSGVLTTGVSEGTLIALRAATVAALGPECRSSGILGATQKPVFYLSDQTHDCARKAILLLGFGEDHIHVIKTDDAFKMPSSALKGAIEKDLRDGRQPIAAIATVGTVNTGACDDIEAIGDVCRELGVWLHVDGAFGIWTTLTPELKHLTRGVERADSLVFDLHKWMYQVYDVGCVLIADANLHRTALETHADYLAPLSGSVRDGPANLSSRGIQLSRGFKALKVWFSLKAEGVTSFAKAIQKNLQLARYLTDKVAASTALELLSPTTLHIVNLRYIPAGSSAGEIDACNQEIVRRLQSEGIAVPSSTVIDGKFSIRICFSNHRTTENHVDRVFEEILKKGQGHAE